MRNTMAARLEQPPEEHLAHVPESLRDEYLRPFTEADELGRRFWMRFRSEADAADWCRCVRGMLPAAIERAGTLSPHTLYLGEDLDW
ncbi:hypothetical protein [Angustibacter luteus]|uniref:Uncharacterized protein n=1 Tax=Angustibacter luteus TaxID=658456 RepID=A0ABW1JCH9_9ACTN